MLEPEGRIAALEERVAKLEKQMALMLKKKNAAPPSRQRGDASERYDALDYPER